MKYLVRESFIDVIGPIWWPAGAMCAQHVDLDSYAIENIRGYSHRDAADEDIPNLPITREGIQLWIDTHVGDFQHVADFRASIEDGEETVDFNWEDEDSEYTYNDAMFGDED